ncbi:MAG: PQQ-dependent sugar dehydrogenase, partial [Rhodothermales bacterium]|nr:PQQ-dependent sugar dehydrogenase [Rhodothermales bacterium]
EKEGTYSIPDGNLFSTDVSGARPEIYIMGNRNPFRISIDPKTGDLFWGEVGPDAPRDSTLGPKGYDELNRATRAGNYGWPYAIADNQAYADYDFETGTVKESFDCVEPKNDSPNNAGPTTLPPCRPAWIWYPYDASKEFPLVGSGGRTSMAGPVYRYAEGHDPRALPPYYDGKLFVYEWMRGWVATVRLNSPGIPLMETFMPAIEFSRPMDMTVGPDGILYLLEYGNEWNARNPDARLTRIEFLTDDSRLARAPAPRTSEDRTVDSSPAGHAGGPATTENTIIVGESMVRSSDCSACHKLNESSIGPSFVAIADRYRGEDGAAELLASKVRSGGSGVWGTQPMIPHPQHTMEEINAMVAYILQLRAPEE